MSFREAKSNEESQTKSGEKKVLKSFGFIDFVDWIPACTGMTLKNAGIKLLGVIPAEAGILVQYQFFPVISAKPHLA
jgi:hypothetical protein